jgi:predicted kinase
VHHVREAVEEIQWDVAMRALDQGVDVILDWGFWSREERSRLREIAEAGGAQVEVIVLEASRAVLWERISRRNADLPPETFAITEEELDRWIGWWEGEE